MMTEDKKIYVISVYSENQIGLLGSISNIFARRNINIESLTVFPSEFPGVHHFTFRVTADERIAAMLVRLIEKKVDVIKAFWYVYDEYLAKEHAVIAEWIEQTRNKQLKNQ